MSDADRYEGKPLLRVLDAYVLDAMGVLDDGSRAQMTAMQPKLATALGVDASTWQGVVEAALEIPPDSAPALRGIWESTEAQAAAEGVDVDPIAFAHELVDARFADAG